MRAPETSARRRRAALLAVVSLAAGGCGSGSGDKAAGPLEEVRVAMRERAAMLAEGDVDGYLETVGPEAMDLERDLAEGAAAVPLSYVNATVTPDGPRTATAVGNAIVEIVYRYEGLPEDNLFRFSLSYDLEKRDGVWTVITSLPTEEADLPVWANGPIEAKRSEHFLALYRPGLPRAADALDVAEEARTALAQRLDVVHSDPVDLILLAGSEEEYEEFAGRPTDEGELASAGFLFRAFSKAENRRMVVKAHRLVDETTTAAFEDGLRASPRIIFQHELGHLALTRLDGPYTPGWVNEGAAMYLAGERRIAAWKLDLEEGAYDDVSIRSVANEESLADGVEYAYVNATVLYLIEEYGAEKFFDFYGGFLPLGVTPEFEADPAGVVLAENYDISVTDLDRRTREYMDKAVAAG
ncbi:MAG: hypothetical protein ACR2MO_15960 [Acidimicrobiales bacterium]